MRQTRGCPQSIAFALLMIHGHAVRSGVGQMVTQHLGNKLKSLPPKLAPEAPPLQTSIKTIDIEVTYPPTGWQSNGGSLWGSISHLQRCQEWQTVPIVLFETQPQACCPRVPVTPVLLGQVVGQVSKNTLGKWL